MLVRYTSLSGHERWKRITSKDDKVVSEHENRIELIHLFLHLNFFFPTYHYISRTFTKLHEIHYRPTCFHVLKFLPAIKFDLFGAASENVMTYLRT